jgi:small subunit ribosomal protein S21
MIKVQVRSNEPLEAALRRFKRQCNYAGVFRLAKKYSFHEKRSDERRREGRERVRNIQRAQRKLDEKVRPARRKKSKIKAGQKQQGEGENTETQNTEGQTQNQAQQGAEKPVTVDQVNAAADKQAEGTGGVNIAPATGKPAGEQG